MQQLALRSSITKTIQKEKVKLQHLQAEEKNTPLPLMMITQQ